MRLKVKRLLKYEKAFGSKENLDIFVERLRRMRAMHDDPSLIGMDNFILKQLNLKSINKVINQKGAGAF